MKYIRFEKGCKLNYSKVNRWLVSRTTDGLIDTNLSCMN